MSDKTLPTRRFDARKAAPETYKALLEFSRAAASGLERPLVELVLIRASQINGCAYCVDQHTRDARRAGEDERRLHNLVTWHESPLFTTRERAALELTESVTLVSETKVPDAVWERAAKEFDDSELAHLLLTISAINALTRIGVATRMSPPAKVPST